MSTNLDRSIDSFRAFFPRLCITRITPRWVVITDDTARGFADCRLMTSAVLAAVQAARVDGEDDNHTFFEFVLPPKRDSDVPRRVLAAARRQFGCRDITCRITTSNPFLTLNSALLTEAQAARFLGVSPKTIKTWRQRQVAPPFVQFGSVVRYEHSALEEWAR